MVNILSRSSLRIKKNPRQRDMDIRHRAEEQWCRMPIPQLWGGCEFDGQGRLSSEEGCEDVKHLRHPKIGSVCLASKSEFLANFRFDRTKKIFELTFVGHQSPTCENLAGANQGCASRNIGPMNPLSTLEAFSPRPCSPKRKLN